MLDKELLVLLACPKCNGDLTLENDSLVCHNDKLAFPIIDNIPILLIEEGVLID